MTTRKMAANYSPEVWARAVRLVPEHGGEHTSQQAAIGPMAAKIGWTTETLRRGGAAGRARPGPPGGHYR